MQTKVPKIMSPCQKRRNGIPRTYGSTRLAQMVTGGMNPRIAMSMKMIDFFSPFVSPNRSTAIMRMRILSWKISFHQVYLDVNADL